MNFDLKKFMKNREDFLVILDNIETISFYFLNLILL